MVKFFDILVVGGGHAGVEAAWISSQFDLKVGIITLEGVGIASAPCNPSIGGVGKGQVVKELDCLGGLMPRLADMSGIQYRTLNESKGYAVQSTRVQIDKERYSLNAEKELREIDNLEIVFAKVERIEKNEGIFDVYTSSDLRVQCKKLIVTVGTFLNGKLHRGTKSFEGGREGSEKSKGLRDIFSFISSNELRFKTGTPPRVLDSSIDFSKLEVQGSDPNTLNFSLLSDPFQRSISQRDCYLAYTNKETIKEISDNLHESPMFNGQIKGTGARYCPSIEDKVFRYPEKHNHHVFIEPEGLDLNTYYPSGISSSLSKEAQERFVRSIEGLENSEIVLPGYAVEYDVLDTTKLNMALEHQNMPGLFFAGQVNGTSGYEEAAGQGFVAGANASLSLLERESLVLSRNDSYIGVMIEDLVTNLRDEPYRLFTARAENRLYMREDNSFVRMVRYRKSLGLTKDIDLFIEKLNTDYNFLMNFMASTDFKADYASEREIYELISKKDKKTTFLEVLKLSFIEPISVLNHALESFDFKFNIHAVRSAAISAKYSEYIQKSLKEIEKIKTVDSKRVDPERILRSENVSFECKQRVRAIMPENFGQLRRINGIRQATLAVVSSGNY